MMNSEKHKITAVLLSTMLFFAFSMAHEFDWLLPNSPAIATSVISFSPDFAEEIGCEDEIEFEKSHVIMVISNDKENRSFLSVTHLFIARVLTPPPDIA